MGKGDEGPQSPPWERAHTPDLLADLHKMWPVRPVGRKLLASFNFMCASK